MNHTGQLFRVSTFGESHGAGIGALVDGLPAGVFIDLEFIRQEMQRRKPGQSAIVTQRTEEDEVQILSGVFEQYSTGAPIALWIANQDAKSKDYSHLKDTFRPSHADFTYHQKYKGFRDYQGGGRASARETAARVAAGALAKLWLTQFGVQIKAYTSQIGQIGLTYPCPEAEGLLFAPDYQEHITRCPIAEKGDEMELFIKKIRKEGDTVGGLITCVVKNVPTGWGEPVFGKLHAELGKAILNIHACKGFEYGSGFAGVAMRGSQHNDILTTQSGKISTQTNHSGGIQGGISNGEDIYFRAAFKPVATILQPQNSINTQSQPATVAGKGRHDPCVIPRAVPIVEAATAMVLADMSLLFLSQQQHFYPNKATN